MVLNGRLAISAYSMLVDGVTVQMTKPVIKLSSFHLCGRKPIAQEETQPKPAASRVTRKKLAAVNG